MTLNATIPRRWSQYPAYRNLSDNLFEQVPAHWDVTKLKRVGRLKGGVGFPHEYQGITDAELPFFKVSDMNLGSNETYMQVSTNTVSHDTAKKLGAHVFSPGSIIFPKVGAALLTNKRRILQGYACLDNNQIGFTVEKGSAKYYFYWLLGLDLGVLANPGAVPSVNERQLNELTTLRPPLKEQRAIATFLDHRTAQIDALIAEKRRLIELLQEKRNALISHAVTKGLDPDVPMKDSGVEWIGEVPGHWEVIKTKYLFRLTTEQAPAGHDYQLLSLYADIGVRPRSELEPKGNKASSTDGYWIVRKGDIVVNKLLAWMGAIGVSNYDGVTSPAYDILRQTTELESQYYDYLFRCGLYLPEFRRRSRGIMDIEVNPKVWTEVLDGL